MEEKMQGVLQPIVEPRVIEVDKEDLDRPMSQAVDPVDGSIAQIRSMCNELVADLKYLQLVYVLKPRDLDRSTIQQHLQGIAQNFALIRSSPTYLVFAKEHPDFVSRISRLIKGTITIIKATKARDELRLAIQQETCQETLEEAHPKYKPTNQPWSGFAAAHAPSLLVANFLAPYVVPVPVNALFPDMLKIKSTATQALPQATSGMLAKWTLDFKRAIDYYHEHHPQDPDFAGPISRKLIPRHQSQRTASGLKAETVRIHSLGNRPYAQAMEWVTGVGEEDKANLARFLGRLERKEVPTPLAANRVYVVRRWLLI